VTLRGNMQVGALIYVLFIIIESVVCNSNHVLWSFVTTIGKL
jgi:hypothetical protein